jgi:hypothetical protein
VFLYQFAPALYSVNSVLTPRTLVSPLPVNRHCTTDYIPQPCLVAHTHYSILVAEGYAGSQLTFHEDGLQAGETNRTARTNSATWEPLEKLAKGEVLRAVLVC